MVLGLLKSLKETGFYDRKKKNYYKSMNFSRKGSFISRRKDELMNFSDKEIADILDFCE